MKYLILKIALLTLSIQVSAQSLRINEVMSSNVNTISDEDGDQPDWLELYNYGNEQIDLTGFTLSDPSTLDTPWAFPDTKIEPDEYLLVFASDKNKSNLTLYWETLIDHGDVWQYTIPTESLDHWHKAAYDASTWDIGKTSIGYGDNDDSTTVASGTISIYLRKHFEVNDIDQIKSGMLHVDYDDGFVAYLNGTEIARSGLSEDVPAFDDFATSHEAKIYNGQSPEGFSIANIEALLIEGENLLAVEVHNTDANSSDLTIIPIISFGRTVPSSNGPSPYVKDEQQSFHTNFKISAKADTLYLRSKEGILIERFISSELESDISYGLSQNGDQLLYFDQPTPGYINHSTGFSSSVISAPVLFSSPAGLYDDAFQLSLSSETEDATIYYTLDGSVPLPSSLTFSEPLDITSNTVIRARAYSENLMASDIASVSYILNTNHSLPIISISADPHDFFDENEGIYVDGPNELGDVPYLGANYWQDWEIPIHIEMFETDGELAFSANAGAKIFGAWSRINDQKSLSIFFRKSYGDGPAEHKIFPNKDLKEFSSLVLRNSGNDWNNSMIRDGLLNTLFHESVDAQGFRPAVIYINGEYWGIQNIREKLNEHFIANNHEIESDSIELLEYGGEPVFGINDHYLALIDYVNSHEMSVPANYEYVETQMDIMNYIYYVSTNVFINNYDWPANNIKFWREKNAEGKWKWITYDKDGGFGIWDVNSYSENRMAYMMRESDDWPAPSWATALFRNLIKNEGFKNAFINTYADQLNTAWKPEVVHQAIDLKAQVIENEIEGHLNRWDGDMGYWNRNIDNYYTYANQRPAYAFDHLGQEFGLESTAQITLDVSRSDHGVIRINSVQPREYPWTGAYFSDIPVQLEAIPKPGYEFVKWEGGSAETNPIINVSNTDVFSVKAIFEDTGAAFNQIVINEINYNSSEEQDIDDWIEIYNKHSDPLDLSHWIVKDDDDSHAFIIPTGTVIGGEEYLVICKDIDNFKDHFGDSGITVGNMDFGLSSSGDCVRIYDQNEILAEEVCYQASTPWPNSEGATLALKDPRLNNTDASNWFTETNSGSPHDKNGFTFSLATNNEIETKLHAFPNPAHQSMKIQFFLPTNGSVGLTVFDMQGRKVSKIQTKPSVEGVNELTWNIPPEVQSGIYLLSMVSNGRIENLRIEILKR